jgi:hypothetical protein
MATKGTDSLSITDATRLMKPDGKIAAVGEVLDQLKGIVHDIPWVEGDTIEGHQVVQRTSLPVIYTKRASLGVRSSAGSYAAIVEHPEKLQGWLRMDEDVAEFGGNPEAKLAKEAKGFAEAMEQAVVNRFIYGNSNVNPEQIDGMAIRFNSLTVGPQKRNTLSVTTSPSGNDQMSMYLVKWGPGMVYGWYPKGSEAGMKIVPFGKVPVEELDGSSNVLNRVVYKEQWKWALGLAVENWKAIVRLCNIDKSVLLGGTPQDLLKYMRYAIQLLPEGPGKPVFYCNLTTKAQLNEQAYSGVKAGGGLTFDNVDGRPIMRFQEIEIKALDGLTEGESPVT